MSNYSNLPAPSPEQGLNRYLQEIRKFPMLEPEQEYMLAKSWVENEDSGAAHKLVTSHLRLAAKIAMGYRGYGLPQAEVISEANVGLMQAVKRFDPEKGFRLATYAMWWIRASIQEYILRSWSLVKLGTTSAQKKLFFNLRKAKARIGALEDGDLRPENVARIAHDLGVSEEEVISMNRRMSGGDASLNATVGNDEDGAAQWQDWLEDESANTAADYEAKDELESRRELLTQAMDVLNDRDMLRALPDGSLGRAYLEFVERENLSADGLTDASVKGGRIIKDPDLALYAARTRDMHDLWHVTTGYGRDGLGELSLLAFTYAQLGNIGIAMIIYFGARGGVRESGDKRIWKAIWEGYRNGRSATWWAAEDWEGLLAAPLEEVRKQLKFAPASTYRQVFQDHLAAAQAAPAV